MRHPMLEKPQCLRLWTSPKLLAPSCYPSSMVHARVPACNAACPPGSIRAHWCLLLPPLRVSHAVLKPAQLKLVSLYMSKATERGVIAASNAAGPEAVPAAPPKTASAKDAYQAPVSFAYQTRSDVL